MTPLTLQQVLYNLTAGVVIGSLYGFALALGAQWFGDLGPKRDGRRTLSPLAHFGAFGLLAMVLFRVGWIQRIDVRPSEASSGRWAPVGVIAIGMATLLSVAVVASLARPFTLQWLSGEVGFTVVGILDAVVVTALGTLLLNLVPLPPLVGGLVWRSLDGPTSQRLERAERWWSLALFLALALGGTTGYLNMGREMLRAWLGL